MTGIRDVAGVDARQWLTLTRAQLTLDLRQRSFGRARLGRPSAGATGLRALAAQALLYAIYGLVLAMVVRAMPDVLLAGIVLTTLVMFVVGTTVVLDHAAALTTTGDYAILGFRPVTSRTYFAARLTNVLIYTTLLTTMVAWLPVASLVVFRGVAMGVAGCAAIYAASFSTAFALLLVYAWMLRLVGSETLKRALGYVQMAVSFVVYGGYFAVNRVLTPAASGFRRPQTPWIYAAPPTWFAGYLDIASGHATPLTWALAAGTVALLAALALAFGGRTSAEFSEHLSDLTVAPARTGGRRDAAPRAGWWFRSGEARAVALLVRSQFRNDQRFKMGVLGILPMTLIYVFVGLRQGRLQDPFLSTGPGGAALVAFAVIVFPTMLKLQLTRSDSFRASWIFYATPANRARLIRASTTIVVAMFLAPYLLVIGGIFAWAFANAGHAIVHTAVLGLLSVLMLQITVFLEPELPFAQPMTAGRKGGSTMLLMAAAVVVNILLQVLIVRVYRSIPGVVALLAGLAIANVFVALLTRTRVDGEARALEFTG